MALRAEVHAGLRGVLVGAHLQVDDGRRRAVHVVAADVGHVAHAAELNARRRRVLIGARLRAGPPPFYSSPAHCSTLVYTLQYTAELCYWSSVRILDLQSDDRVAHSQLLVAEGARVGRRGPRPDHRPAEPVLLALQANAGTRFASS